MADDVSTALAALIQQVTTLTEKVEANEQRYDDVYRVNGKLLEQLKGPKPANPPKDDMAALSQSMKALADKLSKPVQDPVQHRKEVEPVTISRSAALDPRQYEAAKKQARELGVNVEMIDDRPSAQNDRPAPYLSREVDTSAIDHVDDTAQRIRYVRHDHAMGGRGLVQNSMAAECDGFRMVTFKSDDDLPDAMKTKIGLMASAARGGDADE